MASSSKSKRRKKRDGKGEIMDVCTREDRISRLPDVVLSHILSFLTTKDAVRSSILSKQWRYTWTSVPIIKIVDQYFMCQCRTSYEDLKPTRRGFENFVDRVLHLNDVSCLQKFYLSCHECYDLSRISEWINAVITRNVKDLELCFSLNQQIPLPPSFFTFNKLVRLKLTVGLLLDVPESANLPSLKILHLTRVILQDENTMIKLLEGCPVLEELDIEIDFCPDLNILFVRSSSLKILRLDNQGPYYGFTFGIIVDVRNLERLDLTFDVREECDVNSLSSLVEVKLDHCNCISELESMEAEKLVELLRKMSNAKDMCLSIDIMISLRHARLDKLPMFHYLTRLELHIHECTWLVLTYLIECSPNLVISLFDAVWASTNDEPEWHQEFLEPKCLMLHLEDIEIRGFKGCANGMKMVRYFLKNATVLKKISIQSTGSKKKQILKKLLSFPRTSTTSQIAFN